MEPRIRASPEQFSLLLDFMERHGDLSKPQQGPQGRIKSERLWVELANSLNSLGGGCQKTSEKWKKVWADWKTKTKKKKLTLSRHASGTGGGPSSRTALTALEERVVAVIGLSAVVGQPGIEEHHGLNRLSNELALDSGSVVEPALGHSSALEGHSQNVINVINLPTPGPSGIRRLPQSSQATIPGISPLPPTPPLPPPTPPPPPLTPLPLSLTPPPHSSRTQPHPRAQDQIHRNRRPAADSPWSSPTTPRRALLSARRNRGLTPFERAAQEFAAVEQRRLIHEEARDNRFLEYEEARDRRLHEREMERIRLEAQRIEVTRQQNELLHQLALLAQSLIDVITQQRQVGSLPSTDPM